MNVQDPVVGLRSPVVEVRGLVVVGRLLIGYSVGID